MSADMPNLERLTGIAESVEQDFPRAIWEPERIREEFGRRSIEQIEASESIHFLCCLERHFMFAYRAALAGEDAKLVMTRIKRPLQPSKLATAVEVSDSPPLTFVSANSGNGFMEDTYPLDKPSHRETHKVAMDPSRPELSWFEHFGVRSPEELHELIPEFDFQAFLQKIVKNNTERRLQRATERMEGLRKAA